MACGDDAAGADAAVRDDAASRDSQAGEADASAADAMAGATYSAVGIIGGLNRIAVIKADEAVDLCVVLRLVNPALKSPLPIATPAGWSVERGYVAQGAASCDGVVVPPDIVMAESGAGSVTFSTASPDEYPSAVGLEVTLEFPAAAPWVPESAVMQAADVPVSF